MISNLVISKSKDKRLFTCTKEKLRRVVTASSIFKVTICPALSLKTYGIYRLLGNEDCRRNSTPMCAPTMSGLGILTNISTS